MNPQRIDTHHHVFPPEYLKALDRLGLREAGGGDVAFPDWSPEASIAMMDRYAVATAMVSISSPGVFFGDVRSASDLARICNEYMAQLAHKYPGRFGVLASVPLPDVKAAVAEAVYALDELRCDGIVSLGSVADKFLGDPQFEPFIQELNRRNAVVFIHPNVHSTSRQLGLKFPAALFEFLADTTRCALNLSLSGTLHRYPNIRWILAHAGGAVACHAWRWALADRTSVVKANAPDGVLSYIRRLYFDTALSPSCYAMRPVMDLAGPDHVLFGSDFPYVHGDVLDFEIRQLDELDVFDDAAREAMLRTNKMELFPQLRK